MGLFSFRRKSKTESNQPSGEIVESLDKPVLGKDSLGKKIVPEMILLHGTKRTGPIFAPVSDTALLSGVERGVATASAQDVEKALSQVEVTLLPEDQWVPLGEIMERSQRGELDLTAQVDTYFKYFFSRDNELKGKAPVLKREILSQALEITPGTYAIGYQEKDNKGIISLFYDEQDEKAFLQFPLDGSMSEDHVRGQHLYRIPTQVDGQMFLVAATAQISHDLPTLEVSPLERDLSQKDILTRLKRDFPWLEKGDIRHSHFSDSRLVGPFGRMAESEMNRLQKLYPYRDKAELRTLSVDPNDTEIMYLATRNYARLAEFAVMASQFDGEDEDKLGKADMSGLKAKDRERIVSQFLADVEQRLARLNNARRALEVELFGEDFPKGSVSQFMDLFVSGETAGSGAAFGKYELGLIHLVTQSIGEKSLFKHLHKLPSQERKKKLMAQLIDIASHENGHSRFYDSQLLEFGNETANQRRDPELSELDKRDNFVREEIWNEWKSVLVPHIYLEEPVEFVTYYSAHPVTREKGGAWDIQAMIDEMAKLAREEQIMVPTYNEDGEENGEQLLDFALILRSALATAHRRAEFGVVPIAGIHVEGFGDLYNRVIGSREEFGGNHYEQRIEECNDDQYYDRVPDLKLDGSAPCSEVAKDKMKKYQEMLLSKINNDVREKLKGRK